MYIVIRDVTPLTINDSQLFYIQIVWNMEKNLQFKI